MNKFLMTSASGATELDGWELSNVAQNIRTGLQENVKRGYKVTVTYSIERVSAPTGSSKYLVASLVVRDTKGRIKEELGVQIRDDKPARAIKVVNPMGGEFIECRQCRGDQFYAVGRSLDLNNWECTTCTTVTHTLTETGMSA